MSKYIKSETFLILNLAPVVFRTSQASLQRILWTPESCCSAASDLHNLQLQPSTTAVLQMSCTLANENYTFFKTFLSTELSDFKIHILSWKFHVHWNYFETNFIRIENTLLALENYGNLFSNIFSVWNRSVYLVRRIAGSMSYVESAPRDQWSPPCLD